jgi:hypothetical protein
VRAKLSQKHIRNQDATCLCWEWEHESVFTEHAEDDKVGRVPLDFLVKFREMRFDDTNMILMQVTFLKEILEVRWLDSNVC